VLAQPNGYAWFRPSNDPVLLESKSNNLSFTPVDDGDELLVAVGEPSTPIDFSDPRVLGIELYASPNCAPTASEGSCFPVVSDAFRVPGTRKIVVTVAVHGAEGSWRLVVIGEAGTTLRPSAAVGALGVVGRWVDEAGIPPRGVMARSTLWLVPTARYGATGVLRKLDLSGDLTSAWVEDVGVVELVGFRFGPLLLGDTLLALGLDPTGAPPSEWRRMDLTRAKPMWEPTAVRGQSGYSIEASGLVTYTSPGDPLDLRTKCHPCSYTFYQNPLDPDAPMLSGEFTKDGPPGIAGLDPTVPAPGGVIIREGGGLYFESFVAPGVRFPLATLSDEAVLSFPPTWEGP
jgi:hypothetical protein